MIKVIDKRQNLEYLFIHDILVEENLLYLLFQTLVHESACEGFDLLGVDVDGRLGL